MTAAQRVLLVGTALSASQLCHVLSAIEPQPQIVGCLLPESSATDTDLPAPVLGDIGELEETLAAHPVDSVLISLPASMIDLHNDVATELQRIGVAWRWIPTLADQMAGRLPNPVAANGAQRDVGSLSSAPLVDPVQLLDRRPRPLDEIAIGQTLTGKRVLITGAGGSIGSELARIVCRFDPAKLILVERSENALFEIDRDIARVWPDLQRIARLHDVTDAHSTLALVRREKPDVIYHAAAHKHVPMMEEHPSAAIENNFYGTRSIADAAASVGVGRLVMISTDKAVNPTSVMGCSKRLAELYIQHLDARCETTCCMVRFGNVLGSACSVLPIWTRQLSHGGPITVTHQDMERYFMTIPEAAGLVLQSSAFSNPDQGGEVFVLDMGEPVRVVDMAKRFIRSQSLEPGIDVQVEFTGVRPGEKLYEELVHTSEDMLATSHESVNILRTTPPNESEIALIIASFDRLRAPRPDGHKWQHASRHAIVAALENAIPEMQPDATKSALPGMQPCRAAG